MKKTAILLVCTALLAAALVACRRDAGTPAYVPHETENTGTPAYVEPAMEGTTIADEASEFSTETALQAPESETAARTEAATSFAAGKTALQAAPAVCVSPTTPSTAAKTQAAPATAAPANVLIAQADTPRPANTAPNTAALPMVPVAATNTPYVAPTTTTATHKGKKVYGYLNQPARNIVNAIVDELARDERIARLYELWYEQREAVLKTYRSEMPERVPLSRNSEFKAIKNAVIAEAAALLPAQSQTAQSAEQQTAPQDHAGNVTLDTAMGSLRLLQHLSRMIDNKIDEGPKQVQVESKLREEIQIKRREQGLRDG